MMTFRHRAALLFLAGCAAISGSWAGLGCSSDDAPCVPTCGDKECGDDGCGSTCACPSGLTCSQDQCLLEGEHIWAMTVVGASIAATKPNGMPWDTDALPGEEKPDGVICAASAQGSTCTGTIQDNLDPVWNMVLAEPVTDIVQGVIALTLNDDDSPGTDDVICSDLVTKFDADTLVTKVGLLQCASASVMLSFQPGTPQGMYQCGQRFCHSDVEACAQVRSGIAEQDICFATPSCGTCACFDQTVIGATVVCSCSVDTGQMVVTCP